MRACLLAIVASVASMAAAQLGCEKKSSQPRSPPDARPVRGLDGISADSKVVIGVDVAQLFGSPLVLAGVQQMFRRDPGLERRFDSLTEACKLDPGRDVARLFIGMGNHRDDLAMVAQGRFAEASLASCVGRSLAGGQLTSAQQGGRTIYHARRASDDTAGLWFTIAAEADTAVSGPASVLVAASPSWLTAGLGDGPKVAMHPVLGPLLSKVERGAAVWFAGLVDPDVGAGLLAITGGSVKSPPVAMFGHVSFRNGVSASLHVVMHSEMDAKALESFIKVQLPALGLVAQSQSLGRLVGLLAVEAKDSLVTLSVSLSTDQVADLLSKIDTRALGEQDTPAAAKQSGTTP